MRSPKVFQRILPTASASIPMLLGGDANPPTIGKPAATQDNVLFSRGVEVMGWPLHAVAVYFAGPAGSVLAAQLYFYDDALAEKAQGNSAASGWVAIGDEQNIIPGKLFLFNAFVPLQNVQSNGMTTAQGLPVPASNGNAVGETAYMLVVGSGAATAGTYTFCVTPVLTSQA